MAPPNPHRPRAQAGNPRPDLQHPGQYQDMTQETHPEAFATPEQAEQDRQAVLARWDTIAAIPHPRDHPATRDEEYGPNPAAAAVNDGDNDEDEEAATPAPEPEDEGDSDYVPSPDKRKRTSGFRPKGKGKGKGRAGEVPAEEEVEVEEKVEGEEQQGEEEEGEGEEDLYVGEGEKVTEEDTDGDDGEDDEEDVAPTADALDINSAGWKFGDPKTQPLTYFIDSDAVGGVKAKTIKYNVDFNSRDSVNKANKTRRLEVNRAKKRHGVLGPLKRPSTKGREYTEESDETITIIHEDYAIYNNGLRIPPAKLVDLYNQLCPGEDRTQASMLSHINNIQQLKDMRNSYPAN